MEIILKYFPDLSDDQQKKFSLLMDIYREWNAHINVISRKDIDHLYERHVLHSLAIARYIQFSPGSEIADVGTGGGFPGIPLAIMFPQAKFTLIDSVGKKIKVVDQVVEGLKLQNVQTLNERIEKLNLSYEFILSRAVSDLPTFMGWVGNRIKKRSFHKCRNGVIYLKGGDLDEELKPIRMKKKVVKLSDYFDEPFFESKKLIHLYR